jgi:hypothetical protein
VSLNAAVANSIYIPQFGRPLPVADRIVFAEPGEEPHRLICIAKQGGKKLWEVSDTNYVIQPCFVASNQVIVTVGADVEECDPESGRLTRLYRSGYDERAVFLIKMQDGSTLVQGIKSNIDCVAFVPNGSWRAVWEVPRIALVITAGQDALFCGEATRRPLANGTFTYSDERYIALSRENGRIMWSFPPLSSRQPHFLKGAAVSNFFLVYVDGTIHCLNQQSGATVGRYKIYEAPSGPVSLLAQDEHLLVRARRDLSTNVDLPYSYFLLTIPSLQRHNLTRHDWEDAVAMHNGTMDPDYVYSTSTDTDWLNTSIIRTKIKTGNRTELYREPLPSEYSRERQELGKAFIRPNRN